MSFHARVAILVVASMSCAAPTYFQNLASIFDTFTRALPKQKK